MQFDSVIYTAKIGIRVLHAAAEETRGFLAFQHLIATDSDALEQACKYYRNIVNCTEYWNGL